MSVISVLILCFICSHWQMYASCPAYSDENMLFSNCVDYDKDITRSTFTLIDFPGFITSPNLHCLKPEFEDIHEGMNNFIASNAHICYPVMDIPPPCI